MANTTENSNIQSQDSDSLILLSRILNQFSTSELLDFIADSLDTSPPKEFMGRYAEVSRKVAGAKIRDCAGKVHKEECRVWREEEERLQMA